LFSNADRTADDLQDRFAAVRPGVPGDNFSPALFADACRLAGVGAQPVQGIN
jgi:hypothetical protein